MEEGDSDHRQAEVGCGTEGVPGENAQATAVSRHGAIQPDLHGKVSDYGGETKFRRQHLVFRKPGEGSIVTFLQATILSRKHTNTDISSNSRNFPLDFF